MLADNQSQIILEDLEHKRNSTVLLFRTLYQNNDIMDYQRGAMGVKGKITPEKIELICEHLREGNYDMVAAQAVGITRQTFYRWIRQGKEDKEGIYFDFRQKVERAKAEGEVALLTVIKKAATRTWTAAAWILERSRPGRWSKHETRKQSKEAWREDFLTLIKNGDVTREDVIEVAGEDLANELFEQAGIPIAGRGKAKAESSVERPKQPAEISEES